ncbi:MAG TPA: DUF4097 family beta strand repeat-containing protein [Acidobacteriota bacterium]|nr:DUF4097 family beta strand repeat-containing protein [Acidobacteriota bacterium]
MVRRACLTLIVSLALCLAVDPAVKGEEYTFDYQRIIEPEGPLTFELTYIEGDLTVTASDDGRLVIEAVKKVQAVSKEEAEAVQAHIEIRLEVSGDRAKVTTNYLQMRNRGRSFWQKVLGLSGSDAFGEVDWSIALPEGCDFVVTNTGGKIDISHVRGAVTIRSSASDITLSSLEGPVRVENSSGNTRGDLLFGDIEVRQAQGEIDLQFVEGDIRIKSTSAAINIRQDRGAIDLTTSTGSVDIETSLDSRRDFFVETESGNINLVIPRTSSGMLDITSETGEIRTEIPIAVKSMTRKQIVGEFGLGGVKVSLSSTSGDVTVAQF